MTISTRDYRIVEIGTGAVSEEIEFEGPTKIERINFSFSGSPASEDMAVSLQVGGEVVAAASFDPSEEELTEVTKVFVGWTLPNRGGSLVIQFDNTGNVLTQVAVSFDKA
jgi:hypothetical protein